MIFSHQQAVYDELLSTGRAFFEENWRDWSFAPRFTRLLIGQSGCGKTHVVEQVAATLNTPLLRICATNWLPVGARATPPTWEHICQFASAHDHSIVFIDELDKICGSSDWSQHVRVEIFDLLDRTVPPAIGVRDRSGDLPEDGDPVDTRAEWPANHLDHCWITAAGAFQGISTRSALGFRNPLQDISSKTTHRELHAVLPTEVLNRCASPILILPTMHTADYNFIVSQVSEQLPDEFRSRFQELSRETVLDAVRDGLGCRWIESLLLQVLADTQIGDSNDDISSTLSDIGISPISQNTVISPSE